MASQARSKNRNRQAEWFDPRDYIIPLGPRGAAFLGVAGLAVPIPTGLRATTDHHQVIILRADIGVTQSDANLKFHWRKRMIRLIAIALALAVVTSAQAMSPAPLHEPWVPSRKSVKAAVPLGYELVASACPEPASVRPAGTSAGVLDGVEAFAFRTTKDSSILASIHLVAQRLRLPCSTTQLPALRKVSLKRNIPLLPPFSLGVLGRVVVRPNPKVRR